MLIKTTVWLLTYWQWKSDNDFGSSSKEYTNAWVDLVNRGGPHHVSDRFYLFIKAVEIEARTILNQELFIDYCSENLAIVLDNTFSKSALWLQAGKVNHS